MQDDMNRSAKDTQVCLSPSKCARFLHWFEARLTDFPNLDAHIGFENFHVTKALQFKLMVFV